MKTNVRVPAFLLTVLIVFLACAVIGSAEEKNTKGVVYTNEETGYDVVVLDDLHLVPAARKKDLIEAMKPITEYGHVLFWTTGESASDEIEQARLKRREMYGRADAVIFVINLNLRKLTIQSDGKIYEKISKSKARSITDNVSRYATDQDYLTCACEAYRQVYLTLEGERIAEPMRYISIACISLMAGAILAILLVFGKKRNPLLKNETVHFTCIRGDNSPDLSNITYLTTTKTYSPQSSSDSGGSSGCGGGSSGCGGGGSSSF
ncbi:MAG: TPM domain-containing protein [Clostridia bacterium]|nr:TPM domain-containing protein [Clostridia bacterium]